MWSSSSYLIDPLELGMRIADYDFVEAVEQILDGAKYEDDEAALRMQERVRAAIADIPEREADFVDLYYFRHKTQTEIAFLFRVSQPTVCYRLQRASLRLHFLLTLPSLTEEEMAQMIRDLHKVLKKPEEDVQIMMLMYETSCQSVAAKMLGMSQGKVRHRLMRSLKILEKHKDQSPEFNKYFQIFSIIVTLSNIRREVQRPTSSSRVRCILDCDSAPSISSFSILGEEEDILRRKRAETKKAAEEVGHLLLRVSQEERMRPLQEWASRCQADPFWPLDRGLLRLELALSLELLFRQFQEEDREALLLEGLGAIGALDVLVPPNEEKDLWVIYQAAELGLRPQDVEFAYHCMFGVP